MTMKRIHREIADVQKEDLGAITLTPTQESLYRWKGAIPGPQGSPYEGGVFNIDIQLNPDYPFSAPKVTFATRIYHMNISDKGGICIDILKQNWSPALSLFKVMLSLSSLLTDPNPQDPLGEHEEHPNIWSPLGLSCPVPSIATEYMRNRQQHDRTAKRWTELYARPPPVPPPAPVPSTSAAVRPGTIANGRPKCKGRAVPSATSMSIDASSGSATPPSKRPSHLDTITIDDQDVRVGSASSSAAAAGRKRQREVDTIDLVEEEERTKRITRSRPTGSRSSMDTHAPGDVIVIDD
ncbi:ubiquitin-conjugating enzyme/RWD-like protein [Pisolithus croceorrhizus]|nr:ubiquitin-conjugating enzyme/RWD-like protein [Pisolithus croceorrhizus]